MASLIEPILNQMQTDLEALTQIDGGVKIGEDLTRGGPRTCACIGWLGGPPLVHAVQLVDYPDEICIEISSKSQTAIFELSEIVPTYWEDATRLGVLSVLGVIDVECIDRAPRIGKRECSLDVILRLTYRGSQ